MLSHLSGVQRSHLKDNATRRTRVARRKVSARMPAFEHREDYMDAVRAATVAIPVLRRIILVRNSASATTVRKRTLVLPP